VASLAASPQSAASTRSSTARATAPLSRAFIRSRVVATALSTKSRTIWSTSRPWKPTSVNFVAST
jgi:hypothetical protein